MATPENAFDSIEARWPCEVQWGDCDGAGIIYYPTYFRWMDSATWHMWESVGFSPLRMRAEHRSMPLVAAECQFVAPALHGDLCEVRSHIARFGGSSFVVAHAMVRRADGMVLARGSETRVWVRFENGPGTALKSAALDDAVKDLFRATQRA
jgi:YbgC/YbaW family acyl-CoA thioester hydrolase